MTSRLAAHPTPEQLSAFRLGKLAEADADRVAAHLEHCEACRRAVDQTPADSFIGLVRAVGGLAPSASVRFPSGAGRIPSALVPAAGALPPELTNHAKFRIVRELGRGGMGTVYLAEHKLMDRKVAIKVLNRAVLERPGALERFHQEVRAAGKLDHPHIVRAFDAEPAGGLHLLVMEFVEGQNLAQAVEHSGLLAVTHACHYVRQAALGLQHAFEQGMVHRDIKPQNLMLTPRGQVKILDFGLARMWSEQVKGKALTQLGDFMGTPDYMAPEQATDARAADIRADIYSLGCVLYFLLAGRPPHQGQSAMQVLLAHLQKEPEPLEKLRLDVPAELAAVVKKMMAKEPGQRYQKPLEVADVLAPFCKAEKKPVTPPAPVAPPARSPHSGTVSSTDTSRLPEVRRPKAGVPRSTAPAEREKVGTRERGAVPAGLDRPAAARKMGERRPAAARSGGGKGWLVLGAVLGVAVLLSLGFFVVRGRFGSTEQKTDGSAVAEKPSPKDDAKPPPKDDSKSPSSKDDAKPPPKDESKPPLPKEGDKPPPPMPKPVLKLQPLAPVTLEAGQSRKVAVQLERQNLAGPVELRLEGLPEGVSARPVTVPAGSDAAEMELTAGGTAAPDLARGRLVAEAGEARAEEPLAVTIVPKAAVVAPPAGEREITNTIGMKLVLIPAGKFWMGSPETEKYREKEEVQHEVEITKPFYMGVFEVTQEEYQKVMKTNPSYFCSTGREADKVGGLDTRRFPVESVSWNDAGEFCKKLSELPEEKRAGRLYRLPTEAEWEYACRGGDRLKSTQPFHFGAALSSDLANFDRDHPYGTAKRGPFLIRTTRVGSYQPNAFGLYDMHGNVWEWCQDWHGPYDTKNLQDPQGPQTGTGRVLRSGSWHVDGSFCRAAYRFKCDPGTRGCFGFRVVCVVDARISTAEKPGEVATKPPEKPTSPEPMADKAQELLTLRGHRDPVMSVAWSPDSKRLASADIWGTVKMWDLSTGQETLTLRGHTSVAWSGDGKRLASAGDEVKVWDAATGQELLSLKGPSGRMRSVCFSPDGKRLASGNGLTVIVWDAATGQEVLSLKGHTVIVDSVAFSPDSKRLASASADRTVRVWDAATGQQTLTLRLQGVFELPSGVAFSPDGKRIVSGGNAVRVWDAATGQETLTVFGHTGRVTNVAWSADGKRLASAGTDKTVKLWDSATGRRILTLRGHTRVESLAWSGDGKRLASAGDAVKVWNLDLADHTPSGGGPKDGGDKKDEKIITTKSGLKYVDLQVGTGKEAKVGDTVTLHYVLTLKTGKKLDSTYDREEPHSFHFIKHIRGLEEGLAGMKEGGKRRLIIPPDLGYGTKGDDLLAIPPNSELHYEIELLKVQ